MSIDPTIFDTLTPLQFITFKTRNPVNYPCYLQTPLIRVAVLDSPIEIAAYEIPRIASMIVPDRRENDWDFCTESGQLQLLLDYPNLSRLILIGNDPPPDPETSVYIRPPAIDIVDREKIGEDLQHLVTALHPKVCFRKGLPKTLFLTYEDDVLYRAIKARFVSPFVGEFLVEDVELENNSDSHRFRRRLRYKRMPNLIPAQVPLTPEINDGEDHTQFHFEALGNRKKAKFHVDTTVLVQLYLTHMVSGLFVIVSHLNERIQQGITPRALCLGVGCGALLSFLNNQLGFQVVGVDADEVLLGAANQYFGLNNNQLIVGDAIKVIQNFDTNDSQVNLDGLDPKFDVVMVDLDSSEKGIWAPPPEFVEENVIQAARSLLHDHGVLIINVVLVFEPFYMTLIKELKNVFHKVYERHIAKENSIVLMATMSPPASSVDDDNAFLKRLKSVIPGVNMDSIVDL